MRTLPAPLRVLVALVALGAFVVGVWMGLARIGVSVGVPPGMATHGAMLVMGFLGTVIGMERAVATGRIWAWVTPLGAAAGAVTMPWSPTLAAVLFLVAAAVLVALFATVFAGAPEAHTLLMGMGAAAWLLASITWLAGKPLPFLVPWLAAFMVWTIAGERLELARAIGTSPVAKGLLAAAVGVMLAGAVVSWASASLGARLTGLGMLLVAAWLLRYDIARRTVRLSGVTRYMATGLLVGYGWLAVSGILWLRYGLESLYDASIHTLFLGFVMSMIMAHAPVVVPALTGLSFPFSPVLWAPLALLHLSVLIRVAGGLARNFPLREWGAILDAVALALFVLVVAGVVGRARLTTASV